MASSTVKSIKGKKAPYTLLPRHILYLRTHSWFLNLSSTMMERSQRWCLTISMGIIFLLQR